MKGPISGLFLAILPYPVELITRRSQVRILPPLPGKSRRGRHLRLPRFLITPHLSTSSIDELDALPRTLGLLTAPH